MVKFFNHFLIAFNLSHLFTEISVFCQSNLPVPRGLCHCCLGFQGRSPCVVS